jgi:oligoribonuclease NrnB/cAMP/cGMP phosphodiesterase (DHH superfamily)
MNVDKLQKVATVVTHARCPDGVASAILLRNALPNAAIVFVQHGSAELAALKAEPNMLFCDFAPPADRAAEFREAGALVLDHHKTAKDIVLSFGSNGVFADEHDEPGVSGALLAYREVWRPMLGENKAYTRIRDTAARTFAEIAGVRDTWQKTDWRWRDACIQASALLAFSPSSWLAKRDPFDVRNEAWWKHRLEVGHILLMKHESDVKDAIKSAIPLTVIHNEKTVTVKVIPSVLLTSDAAELLGDTVDLVVGYLFEPTPDGGTRLQFSLRSHAGFDCAAFAKQFGGGGHTAAAGFSVVAHSPLGINPYECLDHHLRVAAFSPKKSL